ncbi:hypothetical protein GJ496_004653 [Pomphorhynchus laevis]|nr:hypothetical protein GJ496_004653 [Pomphorhynchus laevis]
MKCRILGHISIENTFLTHKDHNHNNEKSKIIKKQLLRAVVIESTESERLTLEIITNNTSVLDDEVVTDLYTYKYKASRINMAKNLRYKTSNEELDDIPELLKKDLNGNPFVKYDNRNLTRRIIIMFSDFAAEYFTDAEDILVDKTSWCVPGQFYQLCTFKVKVFGNLVPLVYILLPNKAEATYLEAFTILKTLLNISVSYIITDFEMGLINALKASFESTMGGCTSHLGQAAYMKLQRCGLSSLYNSDENFRRLIKMFLNLTYSPPDRVPTFFSLISENLLLNYSDAAELIEYFKRQYIGDESRSSIYSILFWNCCLRVLNSIPRTINSLEA